MNSHAWSGQFKLIAWPFSDRLKQQGLASAVLLDNLNLFTIAINWAEFVFGHFALKAYASSLLVY